MCASCVLPALVASGLALIMAASPAMSADVLRLYVSPDGDDAWSGRVAVPTADGTDGPLASLEGARDAIRALKAAGEMSTPIEVLIRGGEYVLRRSFVLEPQDSGAEHAVITYAAMPGERPVFSGGRRIVGWREGPDGLWTARVSAVAAGTRHPRQLFVNGRRAIRARIPNVGYLQLAGLVNPYDRTDERNRSAFRFRAGDLSGSWRNLTDIEVVKMFSWSTTRLPVAKIDEAAGIVHFNGATGSNPRLFDWAGGRYYVENVFEGLDSPGEWYLDRPTGTLYYMPRPGETLEDIDAVMPLVERLVEFRGDAEAGEMVQHITLRGLTFEHASWPMPERGWNERQAQATMETAAIYGRGAEHCTLEDVEVRHVGAHGVWLERGCRYNRMERCHVWDVGAGGVYLGATGAPEDGYNVVHNCFIHHCTEVHGGAIGVWIGRSSYNEVSRCEIADMDYSGMSVGWSWGYAESTAHDNIIADNHIHHCGHRVLSDMGGIYTLGVAPGTELRHNLIHDIWCYPAYSHASGIYLDEGSSGLLVENNIVYRCTSNGFLLHYGRESTIRNNIFAWSERNGVYRARVEDHISFFFEGNIVYSEHPSVLGGRWDDPEHYVMDRNLYWSTGDEPINLAGRTLEQWRAMGNGTHSLIADPRFRDPEHGDFTLADDSPATRIGFQPISMDGIGLYGDPAWVSLPGRFEHQPDDPLPPAPEPLRISEDFETLPLTGEPAPLGGHPLQAYVHTEDRPELVGISDEQAASGTQSLRVEDVADLDKEYNPHFYYRPNYTEGVAHCSFDIRIDSATVFYHEWRDAANPYLVGPSLHIRHGLLSAKGLEPVELPTNAWVHIEVTAALGERAGTWRLAVTLPDGAQRRFDGLAVVSPGWRELRWLGFVSNGTEPAVWYIDNIEVEPVE